MRSASTFLYFATFISVAFCTQNKSSFSPPKQHQHRTRDKRLFLFSVVQFPNDACTVRSDNTMKGICLTSSECSSRGGTQDGNCASGFGTCCMFLFNTCGVDVDCDRNCSYIVNPGYPSDYSLSATGTSTCTYKATGRSDICQIRLDFDNFEIGGPTNTGGCNTDYFDPIGQSGKNPPRICGTNTGQHMYIETDQSTTDTELNFTFNGATTSTTNRTWKIKISFIECISISKAPRDCVQYFTGASGTGVKNYNFGQIINNQDHATCVRREEDWSKSDESSPDPFELQTTQTTTNADGTTTTTTINDANHGESSCSTALVEIPGSMWIDNNNSEGNVFCGEEFSTNTGATTSSVVRANHPNFLLRFFSNNQDQMSSNGYNLDFTQVPCSSAGGGTN